MLSTTSWIKPCRYGFGLVVAAFALPLQAQGTARIIVPFAAGGAADTFARVISQKLGEGGRTWVVDNKPGAGGVIGTESAARAQADGATLLMVTVGHAVNPAIMTKLPYDTKKDFVPVALVASVPSAVVVGPAFTGQSLADLIRTAKAKPGEVQYATSGNGSTSHMAAALLESMAGVNMTHVPYKGASPALQDVMGGRVTMSIDVITSSLPLIKSGKLKALATTGPRRAPQLPEVPTVAEAGIPGYQFVAWYVMLAPAGTPESVVQKLNTDLRAIVQQPDVRKRFEELGAEIQPATLDELKRYLDGEISRWAAVAKERNIKAE